MSLNGLLNELRIEYIESFPAKILLIEALWKQHDMAAIETEFHKMKGTGRTYGVPEATLIGDAVESICQCSFTECEPVIQAALRLLRRVYEAHQKSEPFDISVNPEFKRLVKRVKKLKGASSS